MSGEAALPGILVQGTALREALADGIQAGLACYQQDPQAWRKAGPRELARHLALWAAAEAAPVIDQHAQRVAGDAAREWEAGPDAAGPVSPSS